MSEKNRSPRWNFLRPGRCGLAYRARDFYSIVAAKLKESLRQNWEVEVAGSGDGLVC